MKRFLAASLALLIACPAWAQIPLLTGPQDPSSLQATINALINAINALPAQIAFPVPPVPQPGGGGATTTIVNNLVLTGTPTGVMPTIGVGGSAADPNAALGLSPNGAGNLVFFAGSGAASGTGILQLANAASFVPATGLAACPGAVAGRTPVVGGRANITGYLMIMDWLGRTHPVPTC